MNTWQKVRKYKNMFVGTEADETEVDEELLRNETDTNEEYDYEDDPFNIGAVDFEDGDDDKTVPESEDGEVPTEDNEDTETEYETGDELTADEEVVKEEARSANLVKLSGSHINAYVTNMDHVLTTGMIERTGNFSANDYQVRFIEPAEEIISKCFSDDEVVDKIKAFRDLLDKKPIMAKLAGNETNPFVYEGLQLAYILTLMSGLALVGPSLQINGGLADTAKHISFKTFGELVEALDSILTVKASLGTKIYYTDSIVDIADNTEASIYVNIQEVNPAIGGPASVPASESIGNIIEIRNNGGLMDYLIVMKALEKVSSIGSKLELTEMATKVLKAADDILNIDIQGGDGEEKLQTIIETVRGEIIAKIEGDALLDDTSSIDNATAAIQVEDGEEPTNPDENNEDDIEGEPKVPDIEDLEGVESLVRGTEAEEVGAMVALTTGLKNIIHSKYVKIGVAVAGVYALFKGIGKLITYRMKKKISESEKAYNDKYSIKFNDRKEYGEFLKAEDRAIKSSASILQKEVNNKLPLFLLMCKLCGKDIKSDLSRVFSPVELKEKFNKSFPGELLLCANRYVKTGVDIQLLSYFLDKSKVVVTKENNEIKIYCGSDELKTQIEINLSAKGVDTLFDPSLVKALKDMANKSFVEGEDYNPGEDFHHIIVDHMFKEFENYGMYAKKVFADEMKKNYPGIVADSFFIGYVGEETEIPGYICYHVTLKKPTEEAVANAEPVAE